MNCLRRFLHGPRAVVRNGDEQGGGVVELASSDDDDDDEDDNNTDAATDAADMRIDSAVLPNYGDDAYINDDAEATTLQLRRLLFGDVVQVVLRQINPCCRLSHAATVTICDLLSYVMVQLVRAAERHADVTASALTTVDELTEFLGAADEVSQWSIVDCRCRTLRRVRVRARARVSVWGWVNTKQQYYLFDLTRIDPAARVIVRSCHVRARVHANTRFRVSASALAKPARAEDCGPAKSF